MSHSISEEEKKKYPGGIRTHTCQSKILPITDS